MLHIHWSDGSNLRLETSEVLGLHFRSSRLGASDAGHLDLDPRLRFTIQILVAGAHAKFEIRIFWPSGSGSQTSDGFELKIPIFDEIQPNWHTTAGRSMGSAIRIGTTPQISKYPKMGPPFVFLHFSVPWCTGIPHEIFFSVIVRESQYASVFVRKSAKNAEKFGTGRQKNSSIWPSTSSRDI